MKTPKQWAGFALLAAALHTSPSTASVPQDLTHLSLEDLLNIQVTSVSRVQEPLSSAAAAVQVITAKEISASSARNLPEALRLFSGLSVAQINGRSWAIAARGFNASTSDKLEVRLDGRSLYTPLFSGVNWEGVSLPLDRIERIEVIRGPGASLWGANAVNGVINIVTKSARTGSQISLSSGSQLKRLISAYQGQDFGSAGRWELSLRNYENSRLERGSASSWSDALERSGAGLRVDVNTTQTDRLMVSINVHEASMGSPNALAGTEETMRGTDAIARWTRTFNNDNELELQLNIDETRRDIPGHFGETRRQADFDLRYRKNWRHHELLLGAGFRYSRDSIENGTRIFFDPTNSQLSTYNLYLQDRIELGPQLQLTVGSKLEHNDYSGWELQPSARISWQLKQGDTLWAAVSQASRTPTRVDRDLGSHAPNGGGIITNDEFDSEQARFYELGWRSQLNAELSLDMASWYADYDKLRGLSALDNQGTLVVANNGYGRSYGIELDLLWLARPELQIWLSYAWQDIAFQAYPDRNDVNIESNNQHDPAQQFKLRSIWAINNRCQASALFRRIAPLKDSNTPAYNELDLKFSYQLNANLALSLSGINLLNNKHPEFNDGSGALVPREFTLGIRWTL